MTAAYLCTLIERKPKTEIIGIQKRLLTIGRYGLTYLGKDSRTFQFYGYKNDKSTCTVFRIPRLKHENPSSKHDVFEGMQKKWFLSIIAFLQNSFFKDCHLTIVSFFFISFFNFCSNRKNNLLVSILRRLSITKMSVTTKCSINMYYLPFPTYFSTF